MNRQEFLTTLEGSLGNFNQGEVERICNYYNEAILDRMEDGMKEEEAVACLGNVEEIADEAKSTIGIPTLISQRVKDSIGRARDKKLWMVLVIIGAPIWLSLLIGLMAALLGICIAFGAVIVSGFVVIGALAFAGIVGFVQTYLQATSGSLNQAGLTLGASLMALGGSLALIAPVKKFSEIVFEAYRRVIRWIKSLIRGRQK